METGLFDKNGTPINLGDRTRLVLESGEVREFDVCFKTVKRTTIKTLQGFDPETVDVSITGIFFCWEGNDLLPCVDENGISDVEKMEVIRPPEMGVIDRIKACTTMRELDELRITVIKESNAGNCDFEEAQKAFIRKKNSLQRSGHTRGKEGYSLQDVISEQKEKGMM